MIENWTGYGFILGFIVILIGIVVSIREGIQRKKEEKRYGGW